MAQAVTPLLISLILSGPVILVGCSSSLEEAVLSCDDAQKICYRGNSIDHRTTRERYGVEGRQAIQRNEFNL